MRKNIERIFSSLEICLLNEKVQLTSTWPVTYQMKIE